MQLASEILEVKAENGVHIITGPSRAGKTAFCDLIRWALTGNASGKSLPHGFELQIPGWVIRREQKGDANLTLTVMDSDGVLADDPDGALKAIVLEPAYYTRGVRGLYSEYYPGEEPPVTIKINNQAVGIAHLSDEECKAKHNRLLGEREVLKAVHDRVQGMSSAIQKELDQLVKEVTEFKEQERVQYDIATLALMEKNHCPLYQLTCTCKDETVELVKKDFRNRLQNVKPIPGFGKTLRGKEQRVEELKLRIRILSEGLVGPDGKDLATRLAEMDVKGKVGEQVVEAVIKRNAWNARMIAIKPFIRIKDRLLYLADELGLGLVFDGRKYLLEGRTVENASSSERILLTYCIQQAANLPVVLVDDFGSLDAAYKNRILKHASASGKPVFLTASSISARKIEGVHSWHITDGHISKLN